MRNLLNKTDYRSEKNTQQKKKWMNDERTLRTNIFYEWKVVEMGIRDSERNRALFEIDPDLII